jgi:hypothetical protein
MTTKVLKLDLKKISHTDTNGKPISDPIGARINQAYTDASLKDFALVAAYETALATEAHPNPASPTHLMLFFQKP